MFDGLLPVNQDFIIDDDFYNWAKNKGIDLRKKQKDSGEIRLFQALYKEINDRT